MFLKEVSFELNLEEGLDEFCVKLEFIQGVVKSKLYFRKVVKFLFPKTHWKLIT